MKPRAIKSLFAAAAAVLIFAAFPAAVSGYDSHDLNNYVDGNRLVVYMPRAAYTDDTVRVQVGSSAVLEGKLLNAGETGSIETLILFDNSLSISAGNRDRMKDVVRAAVADPANGERFAFATFDTEVHLLAGMSPDTGELLRVLDEVEFRNQYTWLNDCIYSCAGNPELFTPGSFARILVCSDGSNDNPSGYTADDVTRRLKQCSCELLAVGSLYGEDPGAVSRMFSMARAGQAPVWLLDDYEEDLAEVTEGIRREKPEKAAVVSLEEYLLDGSEKRVQIQAQTDEGTLFGEAAVAMPFSVNVQAGEEKEPEEEPEEEPAEEPENTPEAASGSEAAEGAGTAPDGGLTAESGSAAEVLPETGIPVPAEDPAEAGTPLPAVFSEYAYFRILLTAAGFLALAAAAVLLFFYLRRKKAGQPEDGPVTMAGDDRVLFPDEPDEEPTVLQSDDKEEATVLMMDGDAQLRGPGQTVCMLTLENDENRQKQYTVPVTQDVIIGRKGECTIPLTDDRSVSGHHCVIYRVGDDLLIRDNDSANGTWLNQHRITEPVKLENGDVIGIGRSRWIAAIRFR